VRLVRLGDQRHVAEERRVPRVVDDDPRRKLNDEAGRLAAVLHSIPRDDSARVVRVNHRHVEPLHRDRPAFVHGAEAPDAARGQPVRHFVRRDDLRIQLARDLGDFLGVIVVRVRHEDEIGPLLDSLGHGARRVARKPRVDQDDAARRVGEPERGVAEPSDGQRVVSGHRPSLAARKKPLKRFRILPRIPSGDGEEGKPNKGEERTDTMDYFVLKKVMAAIRELPTLPSVVNRINQLLNDPKTQVADLEKVISADQSLSVKVLKLINSACYGGHKTDDIQQAIMRLGFRTVSQIVTNVSICNMFKDDSEGLFDRSEFWRHSVAVAVISRMIAVESRHARPDEVFTCGLLHDIGKLILDQYLHQEMATILRHAKEKKIGFYQAEKATFPIDHTTVGEMASKTWRLPILVLVAIKHHHTRLEDRKGIPLSDDVVTDYVRLADFIARDMAIGHSGDGAPPEWSDEYKGRVPLKDDALVRVREGCRPDIESAANILDLPKKTKTVGAA